MMKSDTDTEGVDVRRSDGGAVHLRSIAAGDAAGIRALHAALASEERDRTADAASMTAVLAPRSIAVIGYAGRMWPLEKMLAARITRAGFTGVVQTVGTDQTSSHGALSAPTVDQLPTSPDLAIILARGREVLTRLDECGVAGVKAVIVQQHGRSGSETAMGLLRTEMLAAAHRSGLRLVGPGCVGVVNTDPGVRLNSTVTALPMLAGGLGLVSQSGEFGLALVLASASRGLGVSQLMTLGEGLDVSEADLLLWWAHDPTTRVIGVLIDELSDAERFVSIARQVVEHTPVLAVVTPEQFGRRSGVQSRPPVRDVIALLQTAGVVVTPTTQDLLDAACKILN